MHKYALALTFSLAASALAGNVQTLVITGQATQPVTFDLAAHGIDCMNPAGFPSAHLTASISSGDSSLAVRNALLSEYGRAGFSGCVSADGLVTTTKRVFVGEKPSMRFMYRKQSSLTQDDAQLWLSTDGVNFTLLEPQVPITVAGITFETFIGDPQFVSSAPAVGLIGFIILVVMLMTTGVVIALKKSRRVVA
jgi:hypothetical protein